ncbi:MAG TPA: DUF4389 domain-containing protein [Polyangia bacterium]|nr:DUF4389 domain-containing protein [Polyangia bacterium]
MTTKSRSSATVRALQWERDMITHPTQLQIETPERMQRIHVLIRLVLLAALGTLGWSSLYWLAYLALPGIAALLLATEGSERYLAEDAPRIVRPLRWLASAYAYLWLLTDAYPDAEGGAVKLEIDVGGTPTAASALLRLLTSIPALLLLALMSFAAGVLWIIEAIVILVRARPSAPISDFLALTLRYQFRFIAYHLSLVERYPSLESAPTEHQPAQLGA